MPSKYDTAAPIHISAVSFQYGVISVDKPLSDSTVKMYPNMSVRISMTYYSEGRESEG